MIAAVAARNLGKFLADDFRDIFGSAHDDQAERLGSLAQSAIEAIARSDALYHNYEHTALVTAVGRDIMRGRILSQRIEPSDYLHLICACLLHDIGFVRGILKGDTATEFVVDQSGRKVTLPRGASDAALMPHHVDRSKLFVYERLGNSPHLDPARLAEAIELTRFPPCVDCRGNADLEARLVLASDLIGQLGDPLYPKKANALFAEFEETGTNRQFGYHTPADLVDKYPSFFSNSVKTHIEDGVKFLSLTASGRQWVSNLHNHVWCAEHGEWMMGPQH